jgi:hypothetical protein
MSFPACGLVAAIALVDLSGTAALRYFRIGLMGDFLRNHIEVLHVMARRRLMTLRA